MVKFILQVFSMRISGTLSQAKFLREKNRKFRTSHYIRVNGKILYLNSSHIALYTSDSDS